MSKHATRNKRAWPWRERSLLSAPAFFTGTESLCFWLDTPYLVLLLTHCIK